MTSPLSPDAAGILNTIIRSRRTVKPEFFTGEDVPRPVLEQLLENATWAPTHKKTEPWLFKVFQQKALERLGNYLADHYRAHTPADKFSAVKEQQNREKPLRCAAVIAICMRPPAADLPEWEEIAAVACAVENLWLSMTAYGLSGYWSSPAAMTEGAEFLELQPGERCLGIFYLGHAPVQDTVRRRAPLAEKVKWVTE
ncbi:nitroreductase [Compostibacter hankyongensis]|uniref:Nitroreductase domain-containing protein n=1 Tax=Compostibacter hankyongensis TaxID=1007089 RepID=A0ABP8FSF7_9BACT